MQLHYEKLLKRHKLSLTSVRLAVLESLQVHSHAEVEHIFALVKSKITTASKQAIYNNLDTLIKHGLVRKIEPKGHPALYETRVGDNHHHLICRHCQLIIDVDCSIVAPCLTPDDTHGFVIDEAEVILWGICPTCKTNDQQKN